MTKSKITTSYQKAAFLGTLGELCFPEHLLQSHSNHYYYQSANMGLIYKTVLT